MSAKNWGLLFLLALLWGSSFFFYKILVAVLPPITVVLGRVGIGAIALNLWLLIDSAASPRPSLALGAFVARNGPLDHFAAMRTLLMGEGRWKRFLLLGFINTVIPFVLIAWGETRITSGMASILNATTPIFMVIVAHFGTQDEKMSWAKLAGIGFGILGTVILVGPAAFSGASAILGELAVIGASAAYGFGGVYSRRFQDVSPLAAATGQITGGAVILLPLSLVVDQPWTLTMPGWDAWACLLAIALVNTALAYFIFFKMIASAGATNVSLVTLLIPVIAVMLGAGFLHESITLQTLAGMVVIVLGLAVIDGRLLKWKR